MEISLPAGRKLTREEADAFSAKLRRELEFYIAHVVESQVVPPPAPSLTRVTISNLVSQKEAEALREFLRQSGRGEGHWSIDYTDAHNKMLDRHFNVSNLFRTAEVAIGDENLAEMADVFLVFTNTKGGWYMLGIAFVQAEAWMIATALQQDSAVRVETVRFPKSVIDAWRSEFPSQG